jgi:starch synthase (maltosyl-transferring)
MEQTLRVAQAGFDFIFNSSKWWNFSEPWCLEQYGQSAPAVRSISFPESHDTGRLAAEAGGSREAVRQRYVLAALFATGVMIPIGFEYGFRRRLHVVATRPEDWEQPSWDDTGFIRQVNLLKQRHRVWNEEGPMESLDIGNAAILALLQTTLDETERSLLLFNRDRGAPQGCRLPGKGWVETFLDEPARSDAIGGEASLPPCGFRIFLGA